MCMQYLKNRSTLLYVYTQILKVVFSHIRGKSGSVHEGQVVNILSFFVFRNVAPGGDL